MSIRIRIAVPVVMALCSCAAFAQALPTFDIVTVKPHKAGDGNVSVSTSPSKMEASNVSLKDMIAGNYNVKAWLIFGLPPWAESQKWDVVAKVSDPDPAVMKTLNRQQRRDMVKAMLRDRFGLTLHMESRVQPVFEMSAMPGGVKFHESAPPPKNDDGTPGKNPGASMSVTDNHLTAHHTSMRDFAENLSYRVERTVVDTTGLVSENGYDLDLTWTPEEQNTGNDNGTGGEAAPPIFTAVKDQLGLKLTPSKAEVSAIVVDAVTMPEAN